MISRMDDTQIASAPHSRLEDSDIFDVALTAGDYSRVRYLLL